MGEASAMVLDTGAAGNLARFRWLGNRNSPFKKRGLPRVSTYPAGARFKFGGGILREVPFAVWGNSWNSGARGERSRPLRWGRIFSDFQRFLSGASWISPVKCRLFGSEGWIFPRR